MKLSIVIPRYLTPAPVVERCLQSLQAFADFAEVIVVDASPEPLTTLLPHVRVISKKLLVGEARNLGAQSSSGGWLYFLDSDCILPFDSLDWLQRQITQKALNPQAVHTGPLQFEDNFLDITRSFHLWEFHEFLSGADRPVRFAFSCNFLISRELFMRSQGFPPQMKIGEDVEYCFQLKKFGTPFQFHSEFRILHQEHLTDSKRLEEKAFSFGQSRRLIEETTDISWRISDRLPHWAQSPRALASFFVFLIYTRLAKQSALLCLISLRDIFRIFKWSYAWAIGFQRPKSSSNL